MTEIEVADLLEKISKYYPNFKFDTDKIYAWRDVLQEYDCEEVNEALDSVMSEDKFQQSLPTPYYLVRNLVKKYDKVDYTKLVVYCPICNRPLNQPDYDKHFDRCSSVEYIINQCKRFDATMSKTKKELFEMADNVFENYYNAILKFVQKNTTDVSERERIEFIFNQPSSEKAKRFLSKGR